LHLPCVGSERLLIFGETPERIFARSLKGVFSLFPLFQRLIHLGNLKNTPPGTEGCSRIILQLGFSTENEKHEVGLTDFDFLFAWTL